MRIGQKQQPIILIRLRHETMSLHKFIRFDFLKLFYTFKKKPVVVLLFDVLYYIYISNL
jgi:hypothetical protein